MAFAAALFVGCNHNTAVPDGPAVTFDSIRPDSTPSVKAKLILAGTELPVELRKKARGKIIQYELWAHGAPVELETYRRDDDRFSLLVAADEKYFPEIDLLRFPMKVGQSWSWEGKVQGGTNHTARAKVTTSEEQLYLDGLSRKTIKVVVDRTYSDREPAPLKLSFWFEPNNGIIRREFGTADQRLPLTP